MLQRNGEHTPKKLGSHHSPIVWQASGAIWDPAATALDTQIAH